MNIKHLIVALLLVISTSSKAVTLNDSGKVNATRVSRIVNVNSENDILTAIKEARDQHKSIAMMGKQHSQGGQSLAPGAIELNMLPFNKVISIDTEKMRVTVECGITWAELQKQINPYNLAIKSMQSPNIFSVCGSMSVNAHGDDFRTGSVGNTVIGFHLLLANGKKIYVTRTKNPTLWASAIGGYGLIGVITDVTLQLTQNNFLASHYHELDIKLFPEYFKKIILNNKDVTLFYAHLNITPGSSFLKSMYVITYTDNHGIPEHVITLDNPDKWNPILSPVFNISRNSNSGKKIRWSLEKLAFKRAYGDYTVTRNNAMEKPLTFASNHKSADSADWLQEYFIPPDQLIKFVRSLSKIITNNNVNLLNVTIRYVPAEHGIFLPCAKENSFAVVLYFNQSLSPDNLNRTRKWTRKLINTALSLNGSYYLPYENDASNHQFKTAYPGYKEIIATKIMYDPNTVFTSVFYKKYFH